MAGIILTLLIVAFILGLVALISWLEHPGASKTASSAARRLAT